MLVNKMFELFKTWSSNVKMSISVSSVVKTVRVDRFQEYRYKFTISCLEFLDVTARESEIV